METTAAAADTNDFRLPAPPASACDSADQKRENGADSGGGGGCVGGARYKLMSPAKLPISRSPYITIPPGLSPTSFLESPVMLSNIKIGVVSDDELHRRPTLQTQLVRPGS
ncbi:unnamed protein product [Linum trigynum]|uniref:Uncharacterized protein n=1 Tax=Linum trigynum TaxID=586398 RepID=A0AAV2G690_9ROSI